MKRLVVLVAGLLSVALFAQAEETQNTKENTFSMKVQIRPRAEYRNGVLFPRPKDAESTGFINNRARLSLGYERFVYRLVRATCWRMGAGSSDR